MKKIILQRLFIFLAVAVQFAQANPVDRTTAADVAVHYYYLAFGTETGLRLTELEPAFAEVVRSGDIDLYYVFNMSPTGWVVVSASDRVMPVPAASPSGRYDPDQVAPPPGFVGMMDVYAREILRVIENRLDAGEEVSESWRQLRYPPEAPLSDRSVTPLLSTQWNQTCHYNALCPSDAAAPYGYCGHVPVGCVAVSMAMVMKYWNHPTTGVGDNSYTPPYGGGVYGVQYANFGNTTYDWSAMPNQLYGANTAVATIMYHAGVSVNMQYTPTGSGAYTSDARLALINNFNYSPNSAYMNKSSYSNAAWESMLRADLNAGRPVIYRGQGNYGGHAWVCDGYSGTNHFHMNWGWGGWYDGYFYLSNLNPGDFTFNNNQGAIMNIFPMEMNLDPPTNLQYFINNQHVMLMWTAPDAKSGSAARSLTGYNIYRDGVKINTIPVTNTYYNDLNLTSGSYSYEVTAVYTYGESEPSNSITAHVGLITHDIALGSGWTGISSPVAPLNTNIVNLCNPIMNDLLIVYNLSGVYHPGGGLNTLENWEHSSGYVIRTTGSCMLPVTGFLTESYTIQLETGWNLIPVLSVCDVGTVDLFSAVINQVDVVKEVAGYQLYWPDQQINTLPLLSPGSAYFVRVAAPVTITFPECGSKVE